MKNLLQKLLPLDRVLALALKLGLMSGPLKFLARAWVRAQGARTQGSIVLASLLILAASLGWISWETAKPIINGLVGMVGATALEKLNRILPVIQKGSGEIAEEAKSLPPR